MPVLQTTNVSGYFYSKAKEPSIWAFKDPYLVGLREFTPPRGDGLKIAAVYLTYLNPLPFLGLALLCLYMWSDDEVAADNAMTVIRPYIIGVNDPGRWVKFTPCAEFFRSRQPT